MANCWCKWANCFFLFCVFLFLLIIYSSVKDVQVAVFFLFWGKRIEIFEMNKNNNRVEKGWGFASCKLQVGKTNASGLLMIPV